MQNPLNLISQPSEEELRVLVKEGERATYSRIESVRRCTQISRTLEETASIRIRRFASCAWDLSQAQELPQAATADVSSA